jgi:hypothetical protein
MGAEKTANGIYVSLKKLYLYKKVTIEHINDLIWKWQTELLPIVEVLIFHKVSFTNPSRWNDTLRYNYRQSRQ